MQTLETILGKILPQIGIKLANSQTQDLFTNEVVWNTFFRYIPFWVFLSEQQEPIGTKSA